MLIICQAFLWSAQNVPKSVYRKSPILTSPDPQKIDNRALKLATSSGRNSHGKSRLYTGIVTHSRDRGLVHYVMTLAAFPEASACHRHRNGKERGFELTHRPHHCGLVRRSTNWHGSWIASYTNSFPLPPIPVLNIVNSNDIQAIKRFNTTWHAHLRIENRVIYL